MFTAKQRKGKEKHKKRHIIHCLYLRTSRVSRRNLTIFKIQDAALSLSLKEQLEAVSHADTVTVHTLYTLPVLKLVKLPYYRAAFIQTFDIRNQISYH